MYSINKHFTEKNEEKVIRINWFCKTYEISPKIFKRIMSGLYISGIVTKDCKLVYEI